MRIKLVSHASVIIETADTAMLVDPWLLGKAFNDSWALLFNPVLDESDLQKIDFLWISHEHPDHLHFASLKSLPETFRERVTVLFQRIPSKNAVNALRNIAGFKKIIELPHRKRVEISDATTVYCYHSRQIDSALAIMSGGQSLIDINDVETSKKDRRLLSADLGSVDCVLNQFSIAGYNGDVNYAELIPAANRRIIKNMLADSMALNAKMTIPFASFMYFCCEDNKYINSYVNTPRRILERFEMANMNMKLLMPGESWTVGEPVDNTCAVQFYERTYAEIGRLAIDKSELVPLEKVRKAFQARTNQLLRNHSRILLKRIKPITIRIPDLHETVSITLADQNFEELTPSAAFDLEINSQPLWYGFKFPWGIQTLGVSGRLRLYDNAKHWRRLRYLMAVNNAGIRLRFRYIFSRNFVYFLRERGNGLFGQLIHRIRRSQRGT